MKKRKKLYETIDNKLLELIEQHEHGQLSPVELAIASGKTVKVKKGKKLIFLLYCCVLLVIHVKFFVDMKNFIKNKLLLSSTLTVIINKLITSYVEWDEFGIN